MALAHDRCFATSVQRHKCLTPSPRHGQRAPRGFPPWIREHGRRTAACGVDPLVQPSGAHAAELCAAALLSDWPPGGFALRQRHRRSAPAPLAPDEPSPLLEPTPEGIAARPPGPIWAVLPHPPPGLRRLSAPRSTVDASRRGGRLEEYYDGEIFSTGKYNCNVTARVLQCLSSPTRVCRSSGIGYCRPVAQTVVIRMHPGPSSSRFRLRLVCSWALAAGGPAGPKRGSAGARTSLLPGLDGRRVAFSRSRRTAMRTSRACGDCEPARAWICVGLIAAGIASSWWGAVLSRRAIVGATTKKKDHRLIDTGPTPSSAIRSIPASSWRLRDRGRQGTILGVLGAAIIIAGFG